MHDRCNKKKLITPKNSPINEAIPYIYVEKLFLLLFLYKYISIHTLLKSVMQLINIMHHRGMYPLFIIFLILQMGLIVLVMNVSKHLWPSKYHLLPSPHLEEPPIACAMIHSLS